MTSLCLFAGITVTGQYDVAGIYIYAQSWQQGTTFMGVQASNSSTTPGARPWALFTVGPPWPYFPQFVACNTPLIYTVANLPGPAEGACFNVSDGTDGLAWGATVTNTGSHITHYKVRGNGSNWTVMGK
jgi:hypothetical protein